MASINEKLNYINETKSLIKDKLNNLGSEIEHETTFRDYAEKIEDLYDEWPKINDEDTTISLDNTKKAKINLQLKGNTDQFTTTGKQLFNKNASFSTADRVSVSPLATGIRVTITSAGNARNAACILGGEELLGQTISYKYTATASALNTSSILIYYGSNTNTAIERIYPTTTDNIRTFTVNDVFPSGCNKIWILFYANVSGTGNVDDYVDYTDVMISKGSYTSSTMPSYEPYTGRIASPNPQYPQDVEVVTGENTITISNEDNTENQTFTIDLGNLELYKIGNEQDYIYEINQEYYIKRKNDKYKVNNDLTGNGDTSIYISAITPALGIAASISQSDLGNVSYCNLMSTIYSGINSDYSGLSGTTSANKIRINLGKQYATTIEEMNTYLTNNNCTIYYQRVNPLDIQITDTTLINQLNALKQAMAYSTQTNISQENDNLPFIINATALMKNSD